MPCISTPRCASPPAHLPTCLPACLQRHWGKLPVTLPACLLQVRCEKGKTACYTYRLSKPCPKGRCNVDPDRTLGDGVFTSTPSLLGLE